MPSGVRYAARSSVLPRASCLAGHPSARTTPRMANLTSVLKALQQERTRLTTQIEALGNAISTLNGVRATERTKTMSSAARARIAAAQRARWAKVKGQKVVSITARRRRKVSAAGLARIRAAQKARWAKWRKAQKKP